MKPALPLLFLLLSGMCLAQTTNTYTASSGTVNSYNATKGYLGTTTYYFNSPDTMGSGCYYGSCPAWPFTNYVLTYVLPDGSTATFSNFTGTANFTNQYDIKVQGTASGLDSTGNEVQVQISWDFGAFCRSGRGGGCVKHFLGGTLSVTK